MKKMRIVVGLVVTTLSACGGGSLGSSGTAGSSGGTGGTTGTGGTAWFDTAGTTGAAGAAGIDTAGTTGTGGVVGTGGTSGTPPACSDTISGAGDVVEMLITGLSDTTPVAAAVTGAVTVSGIASEGGTPSRTRFELTGGTPGEGWMLHLLNTAMPPDAIKVGDTFDLTIDAGVDSTLYSTVNQTIVLERDGKVMLFATNLQRFFRVPEPRLEAFGIAVTDLGASCQDPRTPIGCTPRRHSARVAMGSDASIVLAEGQTGRIGGLSVTIGQFTELADIGGICDGKSPTKMAAFRLP